MKRLDRPISRTLRLALLSATALGVLGGPALAGGRAHRREGGPVDPGRGQVDFIRGGLRPDLLPYTRQGHWGLDHRYPRYPLFHVPVPAGPGDCLYETGLFPWQRG